MQILVYVFCADACFLSWYQCLIIILVVILACFLVLILAWFSCADSLFFSLFVLLILACNSCSDACLVVWCMCLLVFLVLMLSCFSCLMLACFSCAVFVMLALLLSCVDGCFLSIFVMSKLVLFCYANSRLRFVLACFPCLVLACFLSFRQETEKEYKIVIISRYSVALRFRL